MNVAPGFLEAGKKRVGQRLQMGSFLFKTGSDLFARGPMFRSLLSRTSDVGQNRRRLLQRLAADREVEFVHRFTVVSNLSSGHSRGNAGSPAAASRPAN
jgi:hypothetical protein